MMRRRSPYGERGLKFLDLLQILDLDESLSLRRAWIEIIGRAANIGPWTSLSLRRAWIEMSDDAAETSDAPSLSLRRAWIEIRMVDRR